MIVDCFHHSRGMPFDSCQFPGLCVHHDAQAETGAQRTEAFADIEATFSTISRDETSRVWQAARQFDIANDHLATKILRSREYSNVKRLIQQFKMVVSNKDRTLHQTMIPLSDPI